MKRSPHGVTLRAKRRIPARKFPIIRFATVLPSSSRAPEVPCLRLQGEWLSEAGFFTHWRVKITVTGGKLVVEPLVDVLGLFSEYGLSENLPIQDWS